MYVVYTFNIYGIYIVYSVSVVRLSKDIKSFIEIIMNLI